MVGKSIINLCNILRLEGTEKNIGVMKKRFATIMTTKGVFNLADKPMVMAPKKTQAKKTQIKKHIADWPIVRGSVESGSFICKALLAPSNPYKSMQDK